MDSQKYKVLIVEDYEELRKVASTILIEEGFEVNTASNLKEALEMIDSKTYHIALVDIMLKGLEDTSNVDGLYLMSKINILKEGTKIIALSAQKKPQITRDILIKYNADDYIDKGEISKVSDILGPISKIIPKCKINKYGEYNNIINMLSGSPNMQYWEDKVIRLLKPKDGFNGLKIFFNSLLDKYLPLLSPKMEKQPTTIQEESSSIKGKFWSKGKGLAIEFIATAKLNDNELAEIQKASQGNRLLDITNKSDIYGYVFHLPNEKRSDYLSLIS